MSSKLTLAALQGKKIAILGLGIENEAMLVWLINQGVRAEFTICDFRPIEELGERYQRFSNYANVSWQLGFEFNKRLFEFDYLFRAPGWTVRCPGIKEAREKNSQAVITSSLNLFLSLCPTKNTIGVTGTKGKGTTSSLIAAIFKEAGKQVFLGGNIGIAPFSFFDQIKPADFVVLELSSFQLEDMSVSPTVAVFTNFSREHLEPADPHNPNYHRNLEEYFAAKANIFSHSHCQQLVANQRLKEKLEQYITELVDSLEDWPEPEMEYFGQSKLKTILPGRHNLENIAAAEAVASFFACPPAVVAAAVASFQGLPHRLEKFWSAEGYDFYDDSFATTPEASMTAIEALSNQPIVIFLGGADKGADFTELAKLVAKDCAGVVLLQGEATPRIKEVLLRSGFPEMKLAEADQIEPAVEAAISLAPAGAAILLSTACASFGMFKNYKERGELFKKAVGDYFA